LQSKGINDAAKGGREDREDGDGTEGYQTKRETTVKEKQSGLRRGHRLHGFAKSTAER